MADFDPSTLVPTPGTLNPANLVPTDQYNRAQENKATEDASEAEATAQAAASAEALPDWIKKSAVTKAVIGALKAPEANDAQLEQFRLNHPILGAIVPVIKLGAGVDRAFLQANTRTLGALPGVSDELTRRTLQSEQDQFPETGPLVTTGSVLGNIASMVSMPGEALPSVISAQAVGQGKANAAALRAQGQEVTPTQEFMGTAGPAAIESGLISALGSAPFKGITQQVSDLVGPQLPEWIGKLGPDGASRAVASFIGKALPAAGAATAAQIADNLVSRASVDPNRPVTQGVGANAAQIGLFHGITGETVNPRLTGVLEPETVNPRVAGVPEPETVNPRVAGVPETFEGQEVPTGVLEPETGLVRREPAETFEGQEVPRPPPKAFPGQKALPGPDPSTLVPTREYQAATTPPVQAQGEAEPARPEAPTEKATPEPLLAPGNLPGHPTRAETPEERAQQPYDFQALRERMANPPPVPEGEKPVDLGKPMTAEQEAAAAPVAPTGEAPEHPEQVEALQERLHELDRRLSKIQERRGPGREIGGRRAEDVGPMPEGEFKTPEELALPAPPAEPAEKPSPFQQTLGTGGQNVSPSAEQSKAANTSDEPKPENDFFAKMREAGAAAQKAAAPFISDEEGGLNPDKVVDAAKAFTKQDILPVAQRVVSRAKQLAVDIDKSLNMGFTTTPEGRKAELSIRGLQGDADIAAHGFESAMAPYLKHVPSLRGDRASAIQYANEIEAGGDGGITALKPAAAILRDKRTQNDSRARALGITNLDSLGFGISRMFVPADPDEAAHLANDPSLMGKYPFYSQKHADYGSALQAAEAHGLKAADDNVLVSQLRRQYQVERYLGAIEKRRADEDTGALQWRRSGEPEHPQFNTQLTGKFGEEERHGSLPSWQVARYNDIAKQQGAFEAQNYINSMKGSMHFVRPGEQPPKGYSFTGVKETGKFYASEDAARFYNNLMPKINNDPLGKVASGVAHAAVLARYTFGPFHALQGYVSGVAAQIGGLARGEATIGDVLNGGIRKGTEIDRISQNLDTATPQQKDLIQRLAAVNAAGKLSSVTDEQALDSFHEAMRNNNPIGAQLRLAQAAIRKADSLVRATLQNVARGAAVNEAERQQEAGITDNEALAKVYDDMSQKLGLKTRGNEFLSTIAHNIGRVIFPAFDFHAGQIANVVGAAKGAVDAATGKVTPSGNLRAAANLAYAALTVAGINALCQLIATTINTGSPIMPSGLHDLYQFRTGNKDANGHWERFTIPNIGVNLLRYAAHPIQELENQVSPLVTNTEEVLQNKDWQGNQIMPDEGSYAGNALRAARHIVSGAAPLTAMNVMNTPEGETPGIGHRLASAFGQFSHPVTSKAEQIGYDALHEQGKVGGRNLRQQEIKTTTADWVKRLRDDPSSEDEVRKEMDNTRWMSPTIMKAVSRRVTAPQGAASLVEDHEIGPGTLLQMWNAATPEERGQMQAGIVARLDDIPRNSSTEDYGKWESLRAQIGDTGVQ